MATDREPEALPEDIGGRSGLCRHCRRATLVLGFVLRVEYTEEPVVSSDIIGKTHSSIFDASFTQVMSGRFLEALSWHDNEWGYSNRVCDLLALMA